MNQYVPEALDCFLIPRRYLVILKPITSLLPHYEYNFTLQGKQKRKNEKPTFLPRKAIVNLLRGQTWLINLGLLIVMI